MSSSTWINCTGDVCVGDVIRFTEGVFGGYAGRSRFGKSKAPTHLGDRVIVARVVKDSYGKDKQQHTFTIVVEESTGYEPLAVGTKTTRKGRNIYRNGTERLPWGIDGDNESARQAALDDKHRRGDDARVARERRKKLTADDGTFL